VLKLGLDMHYRQVTVAMQEEQGAIKAIGRMGHEAFSHWVEKKRQEGWEIHSCYEAGASGYWLDRELEPLGVKNLVIARSLTTRLIETRRRMNKRWATR
jgi:transposase